MVIHENGDLMNKKNIPRKMIAQIFCKVDDILFWKIKRLADGIK